MSVRDDLLCLIQENIDLREALAAFLYAVNPITPAMLINAEAWKALQIVHLHAGRVLATYPQRRALA